jgi:hypothetical protein
MKNEAVQAPVVTRALLLVVALFLLAGRPWGQGTTGPIRGGTSPKEGFQLPR